MRYLFYILLGLLPSLIWLSWYLRKDKHPESNSTIIKIFFWGMLLAPLAVVLELFLTWLIKPDASLLPFVAQLSTNGLLRVALATALVPALVEEYLKYSLVRFKFLKTSAFDEPTDVMIYCIIAALGFAAVENLIILFKIPFPDFEQALGISGFRFLGATFLHALASALAGYYLAKGLLHPEKTKKLAFFGLTLAISLHACYNYLIISILRQETAQGKFLFTLITLALLLSVSLFIAFGFKKLKKLQSVCLSQETKNSG